MRLLKTLFCCAISTFMMACTSTSHHPWNPDILQDKLADFDALSSSSVMVLAVPHFSDDVLEPANQASLQSLLDALQHYAPTKVVLEWEPARQRQANEQYRSFLAGHFSIDDHVNEVYQLGFQLAQRQGHQAVYMFDDQTEFIGSLAGFTFDALIAKGDRDDAGFYDQHLSMIMENFERNSALFDSLPLHWEIALRNSPEAQQINAQRMHAFENRIGIQSGWMGPDWLGRWYRRNVRMSSNLLKINERGDRLLIIVGDNHKWVLDYLFEQIPEFEVDSSWDLLNTHLPALDRISD